MIDKFKNFAILQFERYLNAFWICSSVHKCGGVRLAIVWAPLFITRVLV